MERIFEKNSFLALKRTYEYNVRIKQYMKVGE